MIMTPTIAKNSDSSGSGSGSGSGGCSTGSSISKSKMSICVEPDPTSSTTTTTTPSTSPRPLIYIFKRGTDMKFRFGFLKRRHMGGGSESKKCPTSSTSTTKSTSSTGSSPAAAAAAAAPSVRPSPEEAAKWSVSFAELMSSKYGLALFKAFLRLEFNDENIEFWLAIEDYHKTTRRVKLSDKAQKILNEFILPESPKEINLDATTRKNLISSMSNQAPTPSTFDTAQKRAQSLLESDAYVRFLKSELYMELLHPEKYPAVN